MGQDANHAVAGPAAAGDAPRPLLVVPEGLPLTQGNGHPKEVLQVHPWRFGPHLWLVALTDAKALANFKPS